MTETRNITLGGQVYAVPHLPIRINKKAYPICRNLATSGLLDRCLKAEGRLDCTEDEMADLAELAWLGASAADKSLTRAAFDDLPINPLELLSAFLDIRIQTGAWLDQEDAPADMGEAEGAPRPQQ